MVLSCAALHVALLKDGRGPVPVVDGDNLVRAADELGVEGALDGLLYQSVPGTARKLARLPVDWLAVGLAHLKHEGPVWARLLLAVWRLTPISLHQGQD